MRSSDRAPAACQAEAPGNRHSATQPVNCLEPVNPRQTPHAFAASLRPELGAFGAGIAAPTVTCVRTLRHRGAGTGDQIASAVELWVLGRQLGHTEAMRADMSTNVIHLTRDGDTSAEEAFENILSSRLLRASPVTIDGDVYDVACFSEAPIETLTRALSGSRYAPFGIACSKQWLFSRGGRMVIYGAPGEAALLGDEFRWRAAKVPYPGHPRDHTQEREWRVRADLELEPAECVVIVPTRDWQARLFEQHVSRTIAGASLWGGDPIFAPRGSFPWRVLALDALGVELPHRWTAPPL